MLRQSMIYQQNSFRHILPKANQIVDNDQLIKKTIYPFKMIHHRIQKVQTSYKIQQYQKVFQEGNKFIPPRNTVLAHFDRTNIVYDKFCNNEDLELFNTNIFSIEKLKSLRNHDYILSIQQTKPLIKQDILLFNSRFQSGNLSFASKVQNIYCLLLQNDVNTSGYTNWFYFSVKSQKPGKYNFAIMNYGKAGWPYNNGIGICTYQEKHKRWIRAGKNIQCQSNKQLYTGNSSLNNFNTLSFQYEFTYANQEVLFAYNIPYTYTELCQYLDLLEAKKFPYFYRKLLGRSLVGNRLEILTIANFQKMKNYDVPVVIILSRSHAGETVSSHVVKSFIEFLVSDDQKAKLLRDNFVFKIFPMINPDGVIHGNYRCSLSGRDLNRRWLKPTKQLFPEVYYIKNQILEIEKSRSIKLVIDLHGHTQKKKVFIYGCHDKNLPHKTRLFPYILSKATEHFQYKFCNFSMDKSKLATARITLYNQLKIHNVFTLQSSQFGIFQGHLNQMILKEVGIAISQAILLYFKPKNTQYSNKSQKIQEQLMSNQQLLKAGNQHDSGSQGEPSIDNISFDKLAKMNNKKDMKLKNVNKKHRTRSLQKTIVIDQLNLSKVPELGSDKYRTPETYRKNNLGKSRNISTSDSLRSRNRTYISNRKVNTSTSKPISPIAIKHSQPVKMINFSLAFEDDKVQLTKIMAKLPAFKNIISAKFSQLNQSQKSKSQLNKIIHK